MILGHDAGDSAQARKEKAFRTMLNPKTSQVWDPKRYAEEAGFVSTLGLPVVELLAPKSGARTAESLVFSLSRRIRKAPKRRWLFDKGSNFVSTSNAAIG
jgi:hypothetical protein